MATPHFYIKPPLQIYSPILAKNFVPPPPSDSIFGRSYPLPPFNKGRGGVNYVVCIYLVEAIECKSKIYPRCIPSFCYFLKLISTLDIYLKMFRTPANSWFWSTIISAKEMTKSSIFSAERYFPRR